MRRRRLSVLPPLPPSSYARRPSTELPFPLRDPRCRVFERARHGLWHGVRALGLGRGDEILTPSYHHGSEIEALVQAGLTCTFYDIDESMAPDDQELDALRSPRTRALYLIHYLGIPQDAARWRRWCDERGLLLIEDSAQAWLASVDGRPLGSFGDLAIFCLYKSFGIPDGGAVVSTAAIPEPGSAPLRLSRVARSHAVWLLGRSQPLGTVASRFARQRGHLARDDFALGDAWAAASAATMFFLSRIASAEAAERRRRHYRALLEALGDRVSPAFPKLSPGAAPFAFPVETDRKRSLLQRLAECGVRALDFWSVPHPSLPSSGFPRADALRAQIVALPVHQELDERDVEQIAAAARAGLRSE